MLIVGAKGFAKEVFEIVNRNTDLKSIAFFDNVSHDIPNTLFGHSILRNDEDVIRYFKDYGSCFTLGLGKPSLRLGLYNKFVALGGSYTSTISHYARIGSHDVNIGQGANILDGVCISNSVNIGIGSIIYYNSVVAHDCSIGDFVEISPQATLLGGVKVGHFSHIGAGAIILPGVKIGSNVTVGAGAVVTKNVDDNTVVIGVPAKKLNKK